MFMTEQSARENELRGTQSAVEDAGALAVMSAFNRVGPTADNAHEGLLVGILRNEWGFKGLLSQDAIPWTHYQVLKESVLNGVTMTTKTGEDTMEALAANWPFWTLENLNRDARLRAALKTCMKYQAFALANSNAMDGLSSSSRLERVRTWYDRLLTGLRIAFAVLALASLLGYLIAGKGGVDGDGKRGSAGKALLLLSVLSALCAAAAYLFNSRTDYFAAIGASPAAILCLVLGALSQIIALLLSRRGWKRWMDVLPVLSGGLLTAGLVQLIGSRVNEMAFILTFQKTAANLRDLNSAVAAIGLALLAVPAAWLASFLRISE